MKNTLVTLCLSAVLCGACCTETQQQASPFVQVEKGMFVRDGKPYKYIGANFWYGGILASEGEGGNRERLVQELDSLKSIGIDNLRILVGSDGARGITSKVEPTLQTAPGVYNDTILAGLDFLLSEMKKRDMLAVLYLNNSWEWSGGYSQYLEWAGKGKAPVPSIDGWPAFMDYVKEFPNNKKAKSLFADYRFANLEALKICAYAFYNVGDLQNARLAAISLLQAVPHDEIAQILLDYLNNADPSDINVPFEIAPRYVRHEFVPVKFANYAQRKLIALLEAQKGEPKLGKQELLCLSVLAQTCPSLAITQRSKDYYTLATFVRKALRTFSPQNNGEFFDFCKRHLFDYLPDQSVSEFVLAKMLCLGCCDKVFVSARENSYYVLDCSTIAGASEDFYFAFAICATLFKAPNAAKYLAVYNDIVQTVKPQENLFLLTHHFAYALMRICQKGFTKSEVEEVFSEEEKSLYFTYKELKKQN